MKYLIITNDGEPFYTNWFEAENHFNIEVGMVVIDLVNSLYTNNGTHWEPIEEDHL